ncbi:MAG TPA: YsnF/AvaK domain-containing protein [Ktedonobacteraceae bacterium]|nr:YsnF/AvaK domain-containing protein [Ktedonobacteraceae bacterium]
METAENPVVIGVFRDSKMAEDAIAELHHSGFRDDQIHFAGHEGAHGLLNLLERLAGHEASSGNVAESLASLGVPQEEADYYQQQYEQGRAVVAVQSYGHQQEAKDILYRFGAYDARTAQRLEQVQTIPVREETLVPQKQLVESGQIFIRKIVVTEEKTITVSVAREEVIIERRPVEGTTLDASDTGAGKIVELAEGETIRIPLRQEQVVIEKRPVVAEELIVGKKKVEETQHFTDTVLREEPYVERSGNVKVHSSGIDVKDLQRDESVPQTGL